MKPERLLSALAALGLHAFVLWGWKPSPPSMVVSEGPPDHSEVQVELVAAAPAEEPPAPETPETPVLPEPPVPEPPPPPDTPPPPPPTPEPPPMAEPIPAPEPPPEPKPKPKPPAKAAPKPVAPRAPRPAAPVSAGPTTAGVPTGAATGPTSSGGGNARFKRRVKPEYPPSAKQARLSGRVVVLINLNALGQPISARVSESSGVPAFDEAAVRAARSSEFYPKTVAGIPMPSEVTAPYRFSLNQSGN